MAKTIFLCCPTSFEYIFIHLFIIRIYFHASPRKKNSWLMTTIELGLTKTQHGINFSFFWLCNSFCTLFAVRSFVNNTFLWICKCCEKSRHNSCNEISRIHKKIGDQFAIKRVGLIGQNVIHVHRIWNGIRRLSRIYADSEWQKIQFWMLQDYNF